MLKNTVRGQYGEGIVDGERVAGYRNEPDVSPRFADGNICRPEAADRQLALGRTFRSIFALVNGWRKRATEIVIQFKRTPFVLFRNTAVENLETNRLVIHIQPDEGISLSFGAKVPGASDALRAGKHGFQLQNLFRHGAQHRL